MNEQLEEILLSTLKKAQSVSGEIYDATKGGLIKAVEFAQEQIPDVIRELMVWEFSYHAIWASVCAFIVVTLLVSFLLCLRQLAKSDWDEGGWGFLSVVTGILLLFVGGISVGSAIDNALYCVKIKTAPKLFLVDYCGDLMKADGKREHTH